MDRSETDIAYFERRAREELAAAERATDERACQSHSALARRFAELASGSRLSASDPQLRPDLPIGPEFRIIS